MPDSSAGEAAFLAGEEIVNNARTLAYVENGFGPPSLTVDGGCSCSNIRELINCPGVTGYNSPVADPAPWYDPSVPESADFAGLYITEFDGMSSTYTRENIPRISFGSVVGRQRANERQLTWRGYLLGRTCCAVQFGLRWLTSQLAGVPCGCDTEDMEVLVCCPDVSGGTPTIHEACLELPDPSFPVECMDNSPNVNYSAFRTLKEVALLSGPTILSERKVGCGGGCGITDCPSESCIIEVEFVMVAGNPFFHGCQVTVCKDLVFPESTDCVIFPKPGTDIECGICPTPADCGDDGGLCPRPELPPIPTFVDSCICDPIDPVSVCCQIPDDSFGEFFEGALLLDIYSGAKALESVIVDIYQNPLERPCDELDKNCTKCETLTIRYIPPYSNLKIDGSNKTITLDCPGNPGAVAEHLVSTPFSYPSLRCMNYCLCVTAEASSVAAGNPDPKDNAKFSVYVQPRQM